MIDILFGWAVWILKITVIVVAFGGLGLMLFGGSTAPKRKRPSLPKNLQVCQAVGFFLAIVPTCLTLYFSDAIKHTAYATFAGFGLALSLGISAFLLAKVNDYGR